MRWLIVLSLIAWAANPQAGRAQVNEMDPYYPHRKFPKLITPQWVGEDGVEAVVILAIDDMKEPKRYEGFLRPILRRLQKIDGRAPVSIMSCSVDPADPQLQTWLKEGLSIECHTFDHPCPPFKGGFAKAKGTYDKCVDLMHAIPNTKPVAFRMPCCDSLNTPSPRFWAEIFNKTTAKGNYLTIDSSVFNVFTSDDPDLPKVLVHDAKGNERFKKYLPLDRSFVNTISNYPYPYVIGKLCWEFPCMTPSDWQAQHLHKPCNPQTVEDWKAALDCTVIKQGVFAFVFHPHGWIKNDQMVEFIDYAVAKHGKKVKFLTFKEALYQIETTLQAHHPLRHPRTGGENGVRILDVDRDGCVDAVISNEKAKHTLVWSNANRKWNTADFPFLIASTDVDSNGKVTRSRAVGSFGTWSKGRISIAPSPQYRAFYFQAGSWHEDVAGYNGVGFRRVDSAGKEYTLLGPGQFVDIDGDGHDELIVASAYQPDETAIYRWSGQGHWTRVPFSLPVDFTHALRWRESFDPGLRFIDLDGDGKLDVIFSNEKEYGIYLFKDLREGWSRKVMAGKAGDADALPMISRKGTNNGFWVHSGSLWWSNEDTVLLKDHVDRRSIKELLSKAPKN